MTAIRVGLVDDQELFRAGIRMLIDSQADLEFVGEAGNGAEGVTLWREQRPDVILMDVRMPVMDGIASTENILREADTAGVTAPRIIVLTTFDLDEGAARALRGGASGFLLKDTQPDFLLAAIRTVFAGNAVIAPAAVHDLFSSVGQGQPVQAVPESFQTLTAREQEIFVLAASGLSNTEIATHEFLSEATVKTHISRILSKLSLRDRVQLVVFAYEHGLTAGQ